MKIKQKILIVDDKKYTRMVLGDILMELGFQVMMAHDGKEAQDLINKENFDLYCIDAHIPLVPGFEIARSIREQSREAKIIMFSSMFKRTEEISLAKELKINAFIYTCTPFENIIYFARQLLFDKKNERRKYKRILVNVPISFKVNGTWHTGEIHNLGPEGIFIKTSHFPEKGVTIPIKFSLDEIGEISCNAKVLHIYNNGQFKGILHDTGMGIQLELSPNEQNKLIDYVLKTTDHEA